MLLVFFSLHLRTTTIQRKQIIPFNRMFQLIRIDLGNQVSIR